MYVFMMQMSGMFCVSFLTALILLLAVGWMTQAKVSYGKALLLTWLSLGGTYFMYFAVVILVDRLCYLMGWGADWMSARLFLGFISILMIVVPALVIRLGLRLSLWRALGVSATTAGVCVGCLLIICFAPYW